MLDLKPRHLEIIMKLAARTLPSEVAIWAYGSRVKGQAHSGSDLDLVLRTAEPVPGRALMAFREALTDSDVPFFVDVHNWHTIPVSFHDQILARYEVLRPGAAEMIAA